MNAIRTILFPTDLTDRTEALFGLARSIARDRGARLLVLHVVPERPLVAAATNPLERERARHVEEDLSAYKREMGKKLRALQSADEGLAVDHLLKEGDPTSGILQTAREVGCDLIVMGTRGQPGKEHPGLGSVVAGVIRRSPCPVMMLWFPDE